MIKTKKTLNELVYIFFNFKKIWWALTGSNRRHSACKADALPTELSALIKKTTNLAFLDYIL